MARCLAGARAQRSFDALAVLAGVFSLVLAATSIGVVLTSRATASTSRLSVAATKVTQAAVRHEYGKVALSFEPNVGQAASNVRFLAHSSGSSVLLESDQMVIVPSSGVAPLDIRLIGATQHPTLTAGQIMPGVANYLIGNVPSRWLTDIPTYGDVTYRSVYAGIDMTWHGTQGAPEYDFEVAPGADPSAIVLSFAGHTSLRIDAATGDLVLTMPGGTIREHAPLMYQPNAPGDRPVSGRFRLEGGNKVGFGVGGYDRSRPLIIDPTFTYSTYLGGSGSDAVFGIAVDAAGDAYVAGGTCSADFPTQSPFQAADVSPCGFAGVGYTYLAASGAAFVTKLNPAGSALVYSTYVGGSQPTTADGIAVDGSGNAYITGNTASADFPVTNTLQSSCTSTNTSRPGVAFASELNAQGAALVYSTCLGSSSPTDGAAIAIHAGRMYVAGYTRSATFPVTPGALQPTQGGPSVQNAFVSEINPAGNGISDLAYSTYLGGSAGEGFAIGVAVDGAGVVYVTGETQSADFPVSAGAYQPTITGPPSIFGSFYSDAFVSRINPAGTGRSDLLYSTYLGGGGNDDGTGIALGPPVAGSTLPTIDVVGSTGSTDFPITSGAVQGLPTCSMGCPGSGFVSTLNPAGGGTTDLVYSTYVGINGGTTTLYALAIDPLNGDVVVGGTTDATQYPTKDPIQANCGCFATADITIARDAIVTELRPDPTGSAADNLIFSTFVGGTGQDVAQGVAIDSSGSIYLAGWTSGPQPTASRKLKPLPFPTTPGAFQTSFAGGVAQGTQPTDGFVTKIALADLSVSVSAHPSSGTVHQPLTYAIIVNNAGPSPVSSAVTDVLPKGLTFVSASPGCTVGSGQTHVVTCRLGTIAAGSSTPVTIAVKVGAKGTFTNSASVDGNAADLTPADNSATVTTVVT